MSSEPKNIDTTSLKGTAPSDMRPIDRWVEQAALIMVPTGLVLILLGWVGASRTPLLFEQIPYMISGGLFGLAISVTGGLLYVGGWIARTAQILRAGTAGDDLLAKLGDAVAASSGSAGNGNGSGPGFVRTPSGTMFHRADCSIVQGRADAVAVKKNQMDQFKPCGMCDPLAKAAA